MSARGRLPLDPITARRQQRADPKWRAQTGDAVRKTLETGAKRNEQVGEEARLDEAAGMQATQLGLPVTWQDGGKRHLPLMGKAPVVVGATAQDVENYAIRAFRTCGSCRYFDLKLGQTEMVKQRFGERLVLEQEWMPQHLGAPMDHMGLCKASGGEMVCATVSNADNCDQYRPKSRMFR